MWSTERAGWWAQDGRGSHGSRETLAARPGAAAAGKGVRPGPGLRAEAPPVVTSNHTDILRAPRPRAARSHAALRAAASRWCHSQVVPQDKVAASTWRRREEQNPRFAPPPAGPRRKDSAAPPQGSTPTSLMSPGLPDSRGEGGSPQPSSQFPHDPLGIPAPAGASASLALLKPPGGQSPRRALSRDRRAARSRLSPSPAGGRTRVPRPRSRAAHAWPRLPEHPAQSAGGADAAARGEPAAAP